MKIICKNILFILAHALLNHNSEELCKSNLMTLGLIIPLAVLWAIVPNDGIALVADWFFNKVKKLTWELPFSRAIETEADVVGLKLASKACFDVREGPLFWDKMKYLEEQMGDVIGKKYASNQIKNCEMNKYFAFSLL